MRLQAVILGLASLQQASAAVAEKQSVRFSEAEIIRQMRENPSMLPYHTQLMLKHKTEGLPMNLQKRQSGILIALLGSLQNTVASMGKVWPQSRVSDIQTTASDRHPDAKRRKIRYGPYRIPPTSEKNVEYHLLQAKGMTNAMRFAAPKPCDKNCMVLAVNASLEYEDGSKVPNNMAGAWLHHVVIFNTGAAVKDGTCGGNMEIFFESGNERSEIRFYFPDSDVKSAYHVRSSDTFVINTELMNMEDKEKWVWLTVDYDYIEGFPEDWLETKVVWMSVGPDRCTGSEWNPFGASNLTRSQQPIKEVFEEYSVPWKSPKNGYILGSNSHLHDGGLNTQVFLEQRSICTSVAHYAKDAPAGMSGSSAGKGGHSHMKRQIGSPSSHAGEHIHMRRQMGPPSSEPGEHISQQGECVFQKSIPIKKDQTMHIKSAYDFTKHSGMRNARGELDEVMAIAGAAIAYDYKDWQAGRAL